MSQSDIGDKMIRRLSVWAVMKASDSCVSARRESSGSGHRNLSVHLWLKTSLMLGKARASRPGLRLPKWMWSGGTLSATQWDRQSTAQRSWELTGEPSAAPSDGQEGAVLQSRRAWEDAPQGRRRSNCQWRWCLLVKLSSRCKQQGKTWRQQQCGGASWSIPPESREEAPSGVRKCKSYGADV